MNEIQQVISALGGSHGWATAALAWMASARLAIKPGSEYVTTLLMRAAQYLHDSPDPDEETFIVNLLNGRTYRVATFLFDLLLSVKLPKAADFKAAILNPQKS